MSSDTPNRTGLFSSSSEGSHLAPSPLSSDLISQGIAARADGQLEEAIVSFQRASELSPQDASILRNLAITQFEHGKFDSCVETCGLMILHHIGDDFTQMEARQLIGKVHMKDQESLHKSFEAFISATSLAGKLEANIVPTDILNDILALLKKCTDKTPFGTKFLLPRFKLITESLPLACGEADVKWLLKEYESVMITLKVPLEIRGLSAVLARFSQVIADQAGSTWAADCSLALHHVGNEHIRFFKRWELGSSLRAKLSQVVQDLPSEYQDQRDPLSVQVALGTS
jgi:tetratricopeptide (TPR) repeat protein